MRGRAIRRQSPRHPEPEYGESWRHQGRKKNTRQTHAKKIPGGGGSKKTDRMGERQDAKAQGTTGRKTQNAGDSGGAEEERKHTARTTSGATPARRGASKKEKHKDGPQKKGEAHQNTPRKPALPTRVRRARMRTYARDPGMASSDPKWAAGASARNSPSAPAEAPVESGTVQETGPVSDRVHRRQTIKAHAAQDRIRRDASETTPSGGPERVGRGVSRVPLPRQGPVVGAVSAFLGLPPRAPRSCPVNLFARASGVQESTKATEKPTGAPIVTGPDEAQPTKAGPRGPLDRHAAGHPHSTGQRNQASTAAWCRKPGLRAPQADNHGKGGGAKQHAR